VISRAIPSVAVRLAYPQSEGAEFIAKRHPENAQTLGSLKLIEVKVTHCFLEDALKGIQTKFSSSKFVKRDR
jgi:hypothetical protein